VCGRQSAVRPWGWVGLWGPGRLSAGRYPRTLVARTGSVHKSQSCDVGGGPVFPGRSFGGMCPVSPVGGGCGVRASTLAVAGVGLGWRPHRAGYYGLGCVGGVGVAVCWVDLNLLIIEFPSPYEGRFKWVVFFGVSVV